jgi:hypothetical protein
MNSKTMIKRAMLLLLLACLACTSPADVGLGAFGSYWNTDDADEAFGGGAQLKLGTDPLHLVIRGTYFDDLLDDDHTADIDLQAIPVEAGIELRRKVSPATAIYVGGGVTYCFLDAGDRGEVDDEIGWYAGGGIEIRLGKRVWLFGEAVWRNIEATVEYDDLGEITSDVDFDLSGLGVNVGLVFR